MTETETLVSALNGKVPPWLARFAKQVGRGMHRHSMVSGGDAVLVGVSGGKDSLALALALRLRLRAVPLRLSAALVDWKEYPVEEGDRGRLRAYFSLLGIPLEFVPASMLDGGGEFNCYVCSRRRRTALFSRMEELGIGTLALGHHLDDFAETLLMNLAVKGECSAMEPVRDFFDGRFRIIRPLCEVREETIRLAVRRLALPVLDIPCPHKGTGARTDLKPVVRALSGLSRRARENLYRAATATRR